jgi:hypothetical protein
LLKGFLLRIYLLLEKKFNLFPQLQKILFFLATPKMIHIYYDSEGAPFNSTARVKPTIAWLKLDEKKLFFH